MRYRDCEKMLPWLLAAAAIWIVIGWIMERFQS